MDLSKLKLKIMPGAPSYCDTYISEHNESFQLWRETWKNFYKEIGQEDSFNKNTFYRCSFVTTLFYEESAVALILGSDFNLNYKACSNHSYLNFYDDQFMDEMIKRKKYHITSLESFTVSEEFQYEKTGIPLAYIIGMLASKYSETLSNNGTMISVRSDIQIFEKFAKQCGYERIISNYKSGNLTLDNIFITNGSLDIPKDGLLNLINKIWDKRQDFNKEIVTKSFTKKVA